MTSLPDISISAKGAAIGLAISLLTLAIPFGGGLAGTEISEFVVSEPKSSIELVLLTASVSDNSGQPVTNLRHTDFTVFDQDTQQPIQYFSRQDEPLSVAVVFDTMRLVTRSTSPWVAAICQGIIHFKQRSHEQNEYTLIGLDVTPRVLTDWTRESDVLIEGLSKLTLRNPNPKPAVYDACQLALKKLTERSTLKSAVLLITDGQDTASRLRYSELRDSTLRSDALIYLISPANVAKNPAQTEGGDLSTLSLESGAAALYPSWDHVNPVIEEIAGDLRTRYVIGYYPPNKIRDGAWHPVRITARRQSEESKDNADLIVRTRSGYYSPSKPR